MRVKLDAYPFTDFGLIEGVAETISRDAIEQGQAPSAAAIWSMRYGSG